MSACGAVSSLTSARGAGLLAFKSLSSFLSKDVLVTCTELSNTDFRDFLLSPVQGKSYVPLYSWSINRRVCG